MNWSLAASEAASSAFNAKAASLSSCRRNAPRIKASFIATALVWSCALSVTFSMRPCVRPSTITGQTEKAQKRDWAPVGWRSV